MRQFAEDFIGKHPMGSAVGLCGELGSGKTTFVRLCVDAIARRQGIEVPRVTSPSYVIHQSYGFLAQPVEHFDLYRLESIDEKGQADIGYFEAIENRTRSKGFLFVEWPERARNFKTLHLEESIEFLIQDFGRELICTLATR